MYKVLVDTNILVDFLFRRHDFYELSNRVINLCEENKIKGYVTTSILMDLHYIIQNKVHSKDDADMAIEEILKVFEVIDVTKNDILLTVKKHSKDFEDAVIEECSIRNKMDYIITRNVKDFRNSDIDAIEPKKIINLV